MKNINEITLSDLMGEDFDVWLCKKGPFGHDLEIDDENGFPLIREPGIHPYATEAFAGFCRRYLDSYEKIIAQEQEAA